MTIYLYLKTHNVTGLKYLGKTTSKDPHMYKGSGKIWVAHIRKYGYNVTTQILLATESIDDISRTGKFFSKLFGVVKSDDYANLCEEEGQGGNTWDKRGRYVSELTKHKQSIVRKGIAKSDSWKEKMRRPKSQEHKNKIAASKIGVKRPTSYCMHCDREISAGNFSRWHGDKCKSITFRTTVSLL